MLTIRSGTSHDVAIARHMNDLEVPRVNALPPAEFRRHVLEIADHFWVAEQNTALMGFAVTLAPSRPYESLNYQWFCERYPRFVYLDRIVVAPAARRQGVGRALYECVFEVAGQLELERVGCEVNAVPANSESERFHDQLGFREVGRQQTGPDKSVILLIRELSPVEGRP